MLREAYTSSCNRNSNRIHDTRSTPEAAAVVAGSEATRDAVEETLESKNTKRPNHEVRCKTKEDTEKRHQLPITLATEVDLRNPTGCQSPTKIQPPKGLTTKLLVAIDHRSRELAAISYQQRRIILFFRFYF